MVGGRVALLWCPRSSPATATSAHRTRPPHLQPYNPRCARRAARTGAVWAAPTSPQWAPWGCSLMRWPWRTSRRLLLQVRSFVLCDVSGPAPDWTACMCAMV